MRLRTPNPLPLYRQLRTQLMAAFALVALLSLGVTVYSNVRVQIGQARSQVTAQLVSVAELKRAQINLWLDQLTVLTNHLVRELESLPDQTMLDELPDLAAEYTKVGEYFTEALYYDTRGLVSFASKSEKIGRSVLLQPYFNLNQKGIRIQSPFYDVSDSNLVMFITQPVRNDRGTVIGFWAWQLNLAILNDLMRQRSGLGVAGETYLVSRQNNYLLSESRLPDYPLARSARSEGIDRSLRGFNESGTYENYFPEPVRVIGVYRWIPQLSAGLIAEIDESQALEPAFTALSNSLRIAVAVAAVSLLIGLIVARRLTRPLMQLTAAAERWGNGEFDVRVQTKSSGNEIGELGLAFDAMAQALSAILGETEKRFEEAISARKQAEQADQMKSAFLANMSHELRTPLNAIINFTSFIADGTTGPITNQQQFLLSEVLSSSHHLLNQINDILDMSKIEAGGLQLLLTDNVDVLAILKRTLVVGEGLLKEKSVRLRSNFPSKLPLIRADELRVWQIIMNLISNACKFTQEGEIVVTASQRGEAIFISVSDSGPGIAAGELPMVFEPFKQTATGIQHGGGTGLGLAIAKNLAEAHGGSLWLVSSLGHGATFTLSLPICPPNVRPNIGLLKAKPELH